MRWPGLGSPARLGRDGVGNLLPGRSKASHGELSRSLSNPLVLLQLREARRGDAVGAGGAGGPLRLQWPQGHLEVAGTVAPTPVGGGREASDPGRFRFSFPGVGGETVAATALCGNKSSRACPRPDGAFLRRCRRARGGGVRRCQHLYRSVRRHRLGDEALLATRFVLQAVAAAGDAEVRRVDRPRLLLGFRRRRVLIQVRRGPGGVPGRCAFADGFLPPMVTGNYCGSFQSFLAMELLRIWASGPLGAGHGRRRSLPMRMERTEARVLLVFSAFSRGFFACLVVQLSL